MMTWSGARILVWASRPGRLQSVRRALRRLALGRDGRWALALIAAGVLIRLGLVLLDWPRSDSDEGTMGLMALHIAARGEHPVFFYGQAYMGSLQAYIGAVLFTLFGASVFSLRLGLLLLFALFLVTMYVLIRLLYGPTFALISLLLLDLGGPELLKPQLLALGGYPETLLFGALSLLLATWLALNPRSNARGRARWLVVAAYAGFGLTLGLGWWSDPLVLPFLLAATLMGAVFCYRDLKRLGAVAFGLLVGLAPQIVYTVQHTAEGGPTAVAAFQPQGVSTLAQLHAGFGARLAGTFIINLPDMTGAGWLCTVSVDGNGAFIWSGAGTFACASMRLGWSLGVLALTALAAVAAFRVWRASLHESRISGGSRVERHTTVLYFGRLMLLLGGALALAMYVASPAAAPPGHTRYLIGLIVALPAIVHPLWSASKLWGLRLRESRMYWASLRFVCAGLVVLALAGGVVATYTAAPAEHARLVADEALIHDLERLGIRHMYADYWTCYKVAFLTTERITCAVLGAALEQGNNRYAPYVADVQVDPRAAYVFPAGSAQAAALAAKATTPAWDFAPVSLDGYVVYMPA
jgi:hypothetical protein